jgi:putative protease
MAELVVKNRFVVGDRLELIQPAGNFDFDITDMENVAGESIQTAPCSGHRVWLPLPARSVGALVARYIKLDRSDADQVHVLK